MPGSTTNDDGTPRTEATPDAKLQELVQKGIDAALTPIKAKLDNAFAERDEAKKRVKELEDAAKAAEIKRLQDEGKAAEALQLQLQEANEEKERLARANLELTRDSSLRDALSSLKFRNANARSMAYNELLPNIVKDSSGNWIHKSGGSIDAAVTAFAANADNAFLFETKPSTGGGSQGNKQPSDTNTGKSLFDLSQDEVLKRAETGTLRRKRN